MMMNHAFLTCQRPLRRSKHMVGRHSQRNGAKGRMLMRVTQMILRNAMWQRDGTRHLIQRLSWGCLGLQNERLAWRVDICKNTLISELYWLTGWLADWLNQLLFCLQTFLYNRKYDRRFAILTRFVLIWFCLWSLYILFVILWQVDPTWPEAPSSLANLYDWADYNAGVLKEVTEFANAFTTLATNCNIELFEAYAGTGNASTSCKQQYSALCQAMSVLAGSCQTYLIRSLQLVLSMNHKLFCWVPVPADVSPSRCRRRRRRRRRCCRRHEIFNAPLDTGSSSADTSWYHQVAAPGCL